MYQTWDGVGKHLFDDSDEKASRVSDQKNAGENLNFAATTREALLLPDDIDSTQH